MAIIDHNYATYADSSTLFNVKFDIEEPEENSDRYTPFPPQPRNLTVLVTCDIKSDRPDKDRKCQIRKFYWRTAQIGSSSDFIVIESPEGQFVSLGTDEGITTMGARADMWVHSQSRIDLRGVYSPKYNRKMLFSKTLTLKIKDLPRWKPTAIIGKLSFEENNVI